MTVSSAAFGSILKASKPDQFRLERKVIDWLESKAGTAAKQAVSEQYYSKFEQTDNAIAEVNSRLSNDAKKIAIVVKDMESLTRRMEVIETNLHKTMDDMSGFATTAAVKRIMEREVENILPRGPQSSVEPEPPSHPMDSTDHSRTPANLFDPLPLEPGGTPIPHVITSPANRQAPSVQTATGSTNPLPDPLEIDPIRLTFPLSLFTYLGYPWKRPDFSTTWPSTTLFDTLGTWSRPSPFDTLRTWSHPSLFDALGTWPPTLFGTLKSDFLASWIKVDHQATRDCLEENPRWRKIIWALCSLLLCFLLRYIAYFAYTTWARLAVTNDDHGFQSFIQDAHLRSEFRP
ncbi:hypothetical protein BDN71DRAFT_665055 [Pleurotus eryngii]|uniref:Uncharacterized protein n=1 Tax=Pleurotus eryngii TaxID=5323 RepID=A0A9P5ZFF5_PLEER|nr:hypothetical protein BDN71DRAFT_665055 [Pleurotus eryngii]